MKTLLIALTILSVSAHASHYSQSHVNSGDNNNTCQGNCVKKNSHNTTNVNNRTVDRSISNKNKAVNKNDISNTNTSVSLSASKSKSKSNSNSDSNSSSDNSVSIGGDSYRGSAVAPSVVAMAGYSCTGASASASAGWLGGSLGLGGTKEDKECTKRETAKALQAAVLTGLYSDEQMEMLRSASFDILMNMREVTNPTTNNSKTQSAGGYHQGR